MIFRTITVIFPERIVLTAEHFTCLTSDFGKEKDKKVQSLPSPWRWWTVGVSKIRRFNPPRLWTSNNRNRVGEIDHMCCLFLGFEAVLQSSDLIFWTYQAVLHVLMLWLHWCNICAPLTQQMCSRIWGSNMRNFAMFTLFLSFSVIFPVI